MVGICVPCDWRFLNHVDIVLETPSSCDTVSVSYVYREIYFVPCCTLKQSGKFAWESKVMCLF